MKKLESEEEFYTILKLATKEIPASVRFSNCIFMPNQVTLMLKQGLYCQTLDSGFLLFSKQITTYQLYCFLDLRQNPLQVTADLPVVLDLSYSEPIKEKQIIISQLFVQSGFTEISLAQKMKLDLNYNFKTNNQYGLYLAKKEDIPAITQLWNSTLRNDKCQIKFSENECREYLYKGYIYCLKERNHVIAAVFCELSKQSCAIWHLAVRGEYQGKHLGSSLLRQVLEIAKTTGVKDSWLWVETNNASAISFYQKLDYLFLNKYTKRLIYCERKDY